MANINVSLNSASIQVLDQASNLFRVNSVVGTITLAATASYYDAYFQASTSGTVVPLPALTVFMVYIKNLGATQNLTIQFTAHGGTLLSTANSPVLLPGGVFMYWNTSEASNGIDAVTLTASGSTGPAEILAAA